MAEILYLANHWTFSFHFFCIDIFVVQGLHITQSGAVGGLEWRFVVNDRLCAAAYLAGCPQFWAANLLCLGKLSYIFPNKLDPKWGPMSI
eukprot:1001776-Pelagomonas_calceolata.AAC.6